MLSDTALKNLKPKAALYKVVGFHVNLTPLS